MSHRSKSFRAGGLLPLSLFLGHLPRGSDLSIVCKISMLWYFTFSLSLHFLGELQEKDVTPRHGRCCCCYYGCPPPGSLLTDQCMCLWDPNCPVPQGIAIRWKKAALSWSGSQQPISVKSWKAVFLCQGEANSFGPSHDSELWKGFRLWLDSSQASMVAQMVKNPPAVRETWVWSLGWEDLWRRAWQPTPVFLSGESHGQRALAGYSPWGRKEHSTQHSADSSWDQLCLASSLLSLSMAA